MEGASKDVLFTIGLNSDLPDILRWCQSNKRIYRKVCNNEDFWMSKLLKDYPEYQELDLSFLSHPSLKEKYVFMYQLDYIKKLLGAEQSLKDIFLKKTLDLSNKKLEKIPSFNLPNLQKLYLNSNQLKEVPSFNLPSLKFLSLSDNKLIEVPDFNLPSLQTLYLDKNQLTKVPPFNLPNLQYLHLENNQLTEFPRFNLPALQYLYIENNPLKKVPYLLNLPNFRRLFW